jgi:RND family efflux transporter MFP subunit
MTFRFSCRYIFLAVWTAGCTAAAPPAAAPAPTSAGPRLQVIRPQRQTVQRQLELPTVDVQPFQEVALYPRISGYVGKWNPALDLGRQVHAGEVLAELEAPERVAEVHWKEARRQQAEAEELQARAALDAAEARWERARAQYQRLRRVGADVLERENLDEARLGFAVAQAERDKARADLAAAQARLRVARAEEEQARVFLAYATIRAPFSGIITRRYVNLGDYVAPADSGGQRKPLFVISQLDPVRVFVEVPAADAPWVQDGQKVALRLAGAGGAVRTGQVTRNARVLDPQRRTLRVEIDVPNPDGKLLPGSYLLVTFTFTRPSVWTLPEAALRREGEEVFCYLFLKDTAVRTRLQVGLAGDGQVEIQRYQPRGATGWQEVTGQEQVLLGELDALHDGQSVAPVSR